MLLRHAFPKCSGRPSSSSSPASSASGGGAGDGGAVEFAALAAIVVERVVLGAAVVPDGQGVGGPAEAAGERIADAVRIELLQQRGISFSNAPGCNADSVVDYVLSALTHLTQLEGCTLAERRVGIVGVGNVGASHGNHI